jgi:hypothetical protein
MRTSWWTMLSRPFPRYLLLEMLGVSSLDLELGCLWGHVFGRGAVERGWVNSYAVNSTTHELDVA